MICSLDKIIKDAHTNIKKQELGNIMFTCPVIGKQICLWCCLHIEAASNPMTRLNTIDNTPCFGIDLPIALERDLDKIFETCSTCRVK